MSYTREEFSGEIPHYMIDSLLLYLNNGIKPGDFLTAVLENNLTQAFMFADETNKQWLEAWARTMYNIVDSSAWGSKEKVIEYMKRKSNEQANDSSYPIG